MSKINDWIKAAIRKCGRSHKKRHSVNKERSYYAREQARRSAETNAAKDRTLRKYKDQVAAYWAGEVDTCPEKPQ